MVFQMSDNQAFFNLKNPENLKDFLIKSFKTLNPGTEFLTNWHINALTKLLSAVDSGDIKRLIINIPPRYLKSVCVSVAFPAWILARKPSKRIIVASYCKHLSEKLSLDCRSIMNSDWFLKEFPNCQIIKGQNQKNKFVTTKHGFRFATSISGSLTGEGGDLLIVDDPHNPTHIHSKSQRLKVINWFEKTFQSRLNDKKNGAIIIVMQRLHEDDLTGHLLEKAKNSGFEWFHLNLPVISENSHSFISKDFYILRKEGILHKMRENAEDLKMLKNEIGSLNFQAQYQQHPKSAEGNFVKKEWLRFHNFENAGQIPGEIKIFHSWDLASKAGENHDFSVCTIWAVSGKNYYLMDLFKGKLEYPFLKKKILELADIAKPNAIFIEDKASGQAILQELQRERKHNLIPINPVRSKIDRFAAVSAVFENGRVFFPKSKDWLKDFQEEILNFPSTKHDDQVDSLSQMILNFENMKKNGGINIKNL